MLIRLTTLRLVHTSCGVDIGYINDDVIASGLWLIIVCFPSPWFLHAEILDACLQKARFFQCTWIRGWTIPMYVDAWMDFSNVHGCMDGLFRCTFLAEHGCLNLPLPFLLLPLRPETNATCAWGSRALRLSRVLLIHQSNT